MNNLFEKFKVTKSEGKFILEQSINIGGFKNVTLTLETLDIHPTQNQQDLLELIIQNFEQICLSAKDIYYEEYNVDVFEKFELDFIFIEDIADNFRNWELGLIMKKRFENCIILFDKLDPTNISFSA